MSTFIGSGSARPGKGPPTRPSRSVSKSTDVRPSVHPSIRPSTHSSTISHPSTHLPFHPSAIHPTNIFQHGPGPCLCARHTEPLPSGTSHRGDRPASPRRCGLGRGRKEEAALARHATWGASRLSSRSRPVGQEWEVRGRSRKAFAPHPVSGGLSIRTRAELGFHPQGLLPLRGWGRPAEGA